tara:strand:+ start:13538 stop:15475 length:1938 start_codon:yes stop_codon:yes gene_type:complete
MSAINFPDPSQSPWTNPSTGITYTHSNGVWKALNSVTEQFVKRNDGGVQQVISGGGGLNIIGDVKSKSKTIPTAVMGVNAPADPGVCDFWTDTSSDPPVLKTWNGTEWTAVGSGGSGDPAEPAATTVMGPVVVANNSGISPSVLTATPAIMSNATIQVTSWYKDGVLIPGENGVSYTATVPGVYKYEERHLGDDGALVIEEYSATIQVLAISTPSVTSPANDPYGSNLILPDNVLFSSSVPAASNGTVTSWGNADWQVAEDSGFTTNLQSSTSSLTSSGSQSGPTDFTIGSDTTYYTRTRYNPSTSHASAGASPSDWSSVIQFATAFVPPSITNFDDLFSNHDSRIEGSVTHNGHGFMLYTGYKDDDTVYYTYMDVTDIPKVRFVLIGGGGGGGNQNITCGSAAGGIEGWIDTSNITQLRLGVGPGGAAGCTNMGSDGGDSTIHVPTPGTDGYTLAALSYCGRGVNGSNYNSERRGTVCNTTYVTPISRAKGGLGGSGTGKTDREPEVELSPTLAGAHAHGACSGAHGADQSGDVALGYGGGGPGTAGNPESPGGPLGYRGGNGSSGYGYAAEGPSTNYGTSYGRNSIGCSSYGHPGGGGGGGAFGAPGMEIYDVGEGATGLVKVWWASNTGDTTVLTTVGDLYN